jgi:HAMP domain-containing protein
LAGVVAAPAALIHFQAIGVTLGNRASIRSFSLTEQMGTAALDFRPAASHAAEGPELRAERPDAAISAPISDNPATPAAERRSAALKDSVIYGARLFRVALVYGAAGLAGWLIAEAASPTLATIPGLVRTFATQDSADRAALLRTTQRMEEEIKALRGELSTMRSSMQSATPAIDAVENLGRRIDAMKTETGAAIGALAAQVDGLQRDVAAKPALTAERSAQTERPVVESSAPRRTTVSATVKVGEGLRRPKIRRNDAFEPSKYPNAPGAPRPLGGSAP